MKIAIIGGGAAGMMAAATIAEANPKAKITIYEKNVTLGRKLVATGGGRCNLTTVITDVRELLKNYPRGSQWLRFAMHEFGPKQTYEWFEDHGIKLKTEGLRVFPKSENGEEIVAMFLRILKDAEINYETDIESLNELDADRIIITTGGKSGYNLAESVGHTITPLAPTLTSFLADIPDISGVAIENAKLKLLGHFFEGPFLFTHKGITGPAVFAISSFTAYKKFDQGADLFVDYAPNLSREQIMDVLGDSPKEKIIKMTRSFIPKSLAEAMGIDKDKRVNETSKKELTRIIELIKNYKILITGRTPGREIVTAGGVSLDEVDPKTMQSLKDPRLYFAGEILDVDGLTGGFNLQNAWATGRLAGRL
ncbi:aminoacetone oxidase family FAD-binding enzyme [Patescibacteria group bacterium]